MIQPYQSARARLYDYADGDQFAGQEPSQVFEDIAKSRTWTSEESISGLGSTLAQTRELIAGLPGLLAKLGVHSLLDAPCGDFNWMKEVDLSGIAYTGGDIVAEIVAANESRYGESGRAFQQLDLMSSELGDHDLLFCRDCLVHLSFSDISEVLANLKRSNIRYLMTTTFPEEPGNEEIVTGGWRPLNLQLAPFYFPVPIMLLSENCTEMNGAFTDKSLAVWEVSLLTTL